MPLTAALELKVFWVNIYQFQQNKDYEDSHIRCKWPKDFEKLFNNDMFHTCSPFLSFLLVHSLPENQIAALKGKGNSPKLTEKATEKINTAFSTQHLRYGRIGTKAGTGLSSLSQLHQLVCLRQESRHLHTCSYWVCSKMDTELSVLHLWRHTGRKVCSQHPRVSLPPVHTTSRATAMLGGGQAAQCWKILDFFKMQVWKMSSIP